MAFSNFSNIILESYTTIPTLPGWYRQFESLYTAVCNRVNREFDNFSREDLRRELSKISGATIKSDYILKTTGEILEVVKIEIEKQEKIKKSIAQSNIRLIQEDYSTGDSIRISCSLGIKEGIIVAFQDDRIKMRPYDILQKPFSVQNDSIMDWEEGCLSPGKNGIVNSPCLRELNLSDVNNGQDEKEDRRPSVAPKKSKQEELNSETENHDSESLELTIGEFKPEWENIDPKCLLTYANSVKGCLAPEERSIIMGANGNIIGVNNNSVFVSTPNRQKKQVQGHCIIETSLLRSVRCYEVGDVLGIISFTHKNYPDSIILLLNPNTITGFADILRHCLLERHYIQAKRLCYFLLDNISSKGARIPVLKIIEQLKHVNAFSKIPSKIGSLMEKTDRRLTKDVNALDRTVNELVKSGDVDKAIALIEKYLSEDKPNDKVYSSFLLKKAQIYSANQSYNEAVEAYMNLIDFNANHTPKGNNISHLYTEVARIQSQFPEMRGNAIDNVRNALKYSPDNRLAQALLKELESSVTSLEISPNKSSDFLLDDNSAKSISQMISEDIKAHQFTSEEILNNNGSPTPEIARNLYLRAIDSKGHEVAERYPLFLEIAKAYQQLPTGSYDYNEYLSALAFYAVFKGNYLYSSFKQLLSQSSMYTEKLVALADSATSYYMESLSLLGNTREIPLLAVLTNCLQMNVELEVKRLGLIKQVPTVFSQLFGFCINHKRAELQAVGWATVLEIGSLSASTWNSLCNQKSGTGRMYDVLKYDKTRKNAYRVINRILHTSLDSSLMPGIFIKKGFAQRNYAMDAFLNITTGFIAAGVSPELMAPVVDKWNMIKEYHYLLKKTDQKSAEATENIISILRPYVNRASDERRNLLIQTSSLINAQKKYIIENTTYYGRVFFFPLFTRWGNDIQALQNEQVARTLPILNVYSDPPYITGMQGLKTINLIIENIGIGTAEAYEMVVSLKSNDGILITKGCDKNPQEIPAGTKVAKIMNLPVQVYEYNYLDVEIVAVPIYQKKKCLESISRFSVETEPSSSLKVEEILWHDGRKPNASLFKGREKLLKVLEHHYCSIDKDKSYILYGLTRTGKSSVLDYLAEKIEGKEISNSGIHQKICCVKWDFSTAASQTNASDLWEYLIESTMVESLNNRQLDFNSLPERLKFKDFPKIINLLNQSRYYPLFLIDEFSYIAQMMDKGLVNSAFLHVLRQNALEGKASFLFAGTYDIKTLLANEKYGITGQLVNSIEYQVGEIDKEPAEKLMKVMEPRLCFSKEAIDKIHELSGDIPYFIQIICKYSGYYASEFSRKTIGFAELEKVIGILTGEQKEVQDSRVKRLPENIFQNNMLTPTDPPSVNALLTSICFLNNCNRYNPRGIGMAELEQLWGKHAIVGFRPLLSNAIKILCEKRILAQEFDDGMPIYKITVDLFRRWWHTHHSDINLEIGTIK